MWIKKEAYKVTRIIKVYQDHVEVPIDAYTIKNLLSYYQCVIVTLIYSMIELKEDLAKNNEDYIWKKKEALFITKEKR